MGFFLLIFPRSFTIFLFSRIFSFSQGAFFLIFSFLGMFCSAASLWAITKCVYDVLLVGFSSFSCSALKTIFEGDGVFLFDVWVFEVRPLKGGTFTGFIFANSKTKIGFHGHYTMVRGHSFKCVVSFTVLYAIDPLLVDHQEVKLSFGVIQVCVGP